MDRWRRSARHKVPDLLQRGRIVHGGQVAGVAAFADGLDGTAQHLAAASLGQHGDETHARRASHGAKVAVSLGPVGP